MIMVRRRGRPAKEPAVLDNENTDGIGDEAVTLPISTASAIASASLMDEQYFASPKRKDCRLMKADESLKTEDVAVIVGGNANSSNNNKSNGKTTTTKSERAGSAGRTIGVPLATRSQTRTIENFFKANAAAKNANKLTTTNQTTEEQKTISLTTTTTNHLQESEAEVDAALLYETHSIASSCSPQYQHSLAELNGQEEDEHSNDTEHTGSSECTLHELNVQDFAAHSNAAAAAVVADFQTHRSTLRDSHSSSHSSSSAATDNIFLQEPVLTLDIDRTPSKASSIKINKSFELASAVFSSPPSALSAACVLNGRFNQIVTLNGLKEQSQSQQPISFAVAQPHNAFELDQHDSSSCDSGVACSLLPTSAESPAASATRRCKPATPHRILCPSPIKTLPRDPILLPGARKMIAAASKCDALSPRKSPRKMAAAAAAAGGKSRRRLNQAKPQAPYQHSAPAIGDVVVLLDDDADEEDEEPLEENEDDCHALIKAAEELENLNKARPPMNNNVKTMLKPAAAAKKSNAKSGAKSKSHGGSKSMQLPLPLAATNGNRELTDFFPVRRSVRKTKTAVKEEMMRNLEQAVLEERADGLMVRHFEGKGRGVVADRHFKRNEFVIEYVGDLIAISEATERERRYALDENTGCYMYYFKHKTQQYCIDATVDTGKLGRLINHSRTGNLMTKVVVIKQRPHLVLLAKDDIEPGEELTYDYGDRSKEALLHHPWLAF